jgi:hypothetical protein
MARGFPVGQRGAEQYQAANSDAWAIFFGIKKLGDY